VVADGVAAGSVVATGDGDALAVVGDGARAADGPLHPARANSSDAASMATVGRVMVRMLMTTS